MTYSNFLKELNKRNVRSVYFISTSGIYLLEKSLIELRRIFLGFNESSENVFYKYADEIRVEELIDFCYNYTSLFTQKKIVIVKRCEKYSRNFIRLTEYTTNPDTNTLLILVFDKTEVTEKKLDKKTDFFDFTDINEAQLESLIKQEFEIRNLSITKDGLEFFLLNFPHDPDIILNEIEKLHLYMISTGRAEADPETLSKCSGNETEYTPVELMQAIIKKNQNLAQDITSKLITKSGIHPVLLLSMLFNYYIDVMCFINSGNVKSDRNNIFTQYGIWGTRLNLATSFSKSLNFEEIEYAVSRILQTDLQLKTTMLLPEILFSTLVDELCLEAKSRNQILNNQLN